MSNRAMNAMPENFDEVTLYWYDGEAQQKETLSRDYFNSYLETNEGYTAKFGSIYPITRNNWFSCDNIDVLNNYTTFFFVKKMIFYGEIRGDLDEPEDNELNVAPTFYGDLCCYTEAQISSFSAPGLRLPLGDRVMP